MLRVSAHLNWHASRKEKWFAFRSGFPSFYSVISARARPRHRESTSFHGDMSLNHPALLSLL